MWDIMINLASMVQSIEAFCQRVQQGLAEATFEQKRQLIELLVDRVVVTGEEVEIRYVIPTSSSSEQVRFCHLRLDYFNVPPPALLTSPYLIVQTPEDGWMVIAHRAAR